VGPRGEGISACVGDADASYRLMMRACRQLINAAHGRPGRFVEPGVPSMNQVSTPCTATTSAALLPAVYYLFHFFFWIHASTIASKL
jgi:hypothetical protein